MGHVKRDGALWDPARLCIQGAFTATKAEVPRVGDPEQLLEFLHYHMSPQQRANVGYKPIHHVFSALVLASDEETRRGLAKYDFSDPLFIDTTIEVLRNKDAKSFRKPTIFVLAELDKHLFTTEKVFTDEAKASNFVRAWSAVIPEFLGRDPTHQVERVALKVLLAIAHLPCLRVHLPKERWDWIKHFPFIMNENPPPLQRCLGDATIIPFLKKTTETLLRTPWLAMLWMMYHHLSEEVREQLVEETREVVSELGVSHLDPYFTLFDTSLKGLQTQINELDPLDQAVSDLLSKRSQMRRAKERLLSIRREGENKAWF